MYYMLQFFLHEDECSAILIAEDRREHLRLTLTNWGGDIDWLAIIKYIKFFPAQHVIISPRIQAADGMTDETYTETEVSCG